MAIVDVAEDEEDEEDMFGDIAKSESQIEAEKTEKKAINGHSYLFQDAPKNFDSKGKVTVVDGVEKENLSKKLFGKKDEVGDKYMLRGTSKKVVIPINTEQYDKAREVKYEYEKKNKGFDVEINGISIQLRKTTLAKETSDSFAFGSNS